MATLRLWEIVSGGAWSNPANAFDPTNPLTTSSNASASGVGTMLTHDTSVGTEFGADHAYGKNIVLQKFKATVNSLGNTFITLNINRTYKCEATTVQYETKQHEKVSQNGEDWPVYDDPWSLGSYIELSYSWDDISYNTINAVGDPGVNGVPWNQGWRELLTEKTDNTILESFLIDATGKNINELYIKIEAVGVYAEQRTITGQGPPTEFHFQDTGIGCTCELFDLSLTVSASGEAYYVPILYTNDHHDRDITPGHKIWSIDLFSTIDGTYKLSNAPNQEQIRYETPFKFYYGSELYTPPTIASGYFWPVNFTVTGNMEELEDFAHGYDEHDTFGFPTVPIVEFNEIASFTTAGIGNHGESTKGSAPPTNYNDYQTEITTTVSLTYNFKPAFALESKFLINATIYVCLAAEVSVDHIDVVQDPTGGGFTGTITGDSSVDVEYTVDNSTYNNLHSLWNNHTFTKVSAKTLYSEPLTGIIDLGACKVRISHTNTCITFWGFNANNENGWGPGEAVGASSESSVFAAYIMGEEVLGFKITTGGDLLTNPVDPEYFQTLVREQSLWAGGGFSYKRGIYHEIRTGADDPEQNLDETYSAPAPPKSKVKIDDITYVIESYEWDMTVEHINHFTHPDPSIGPTDHTIIFHPAILHLVGSPDLSSILSIGKIVLWVD